MNYKIIYNKSDMSKIIDIFAECIFDILTKENESSESEEKWKKEISQDICELVH